MRAASTQNTGKRELFASLTGLRFVLAVWIALYHLLVMYGPDSAANHPLIAVGSARVDGFFVMSGFVLAHIYAVRTGGRFAFWPFLQARIARLYPLHLLALVMLLGLVLAAIAIGRGGEAGQFTPLGFVANLLMLQAWNISGAGQWNFPAWTLSAEFFGYLCFPAIVALAARMAGRPLLLLGLALGFVAALDAAWQAAGNDALGAITQNWGILRGACGVLVGVAARYAFEVFSPRGVMAVAFSVVGAIGAGLAAITAAPLFLLHTGAVAMLLGLAGLDRSGQATPLSGPLMQRLGDMSYALFILHVPIFMTATQALSIAGWNGQLDWASGAAILAVAMGASALANRLLEDPAREIIRGWRPFDRSPVKTLRS